MLKVVEKKKIWFSISAIIIAIGLIAMFTKGLNFGIDFEGGTNIILKFDEEYNKEDVDSIVKGFASDAVTNTAENNEYEIKSKNFESKDVSKLVEELKKKVEEAEPWFKKKEDEKKAEADKIRKEQEAKEKKEAEAREKEEKQGYETGITYDQLARTPDKYVGKSVKFSGKVIQVIEAGTEVQMRLAVNNNYDTILYCAVPKSEMNGSRILENDKITIYGMSNGIITYESTLGGKISIPSVIIDKYE